MASWVKQKSEKIRTTVAASTVQYSHFVLFIKVWIPDIKVSEKLLPGESMVMKMRAKVIKSYTVKIP